MGTQPAPTPRTGSLFMPPSRRHALKKAKPRLPKAGITKPIRSAYQRHTLIAALRKRHIFKKLLAEARGKAGNPDPQVKYRSLDPVESKQGLLARIKKRLMGDASLNPATSSAAVTLSPINKESN